MVLINERVFYRCAAQREAGGRLRLEGCLAWIECGLHQLLKDGDPHHRALPGARFWLARQLGTGFLAQPLSAVCASRGAAAKTQSFGASALDADL